MKLLNVAMFCGTGLVVIAGFVYGIERRAAFVGSPTSHIDIGNGGYYVISYRIQNLTPFQMRLVSRAQGCSDKPEIGEIGPYGSKEYAITLTASDLGEGKHDVAFEAVGYVRDEPFLLSKSLTVEVSK